MKPFKYPIFATAAKVPEGLIASAGKARLIYFCQKLRHPSQRRLCQTRSRPVCQNLNSRMDFEVLKLHLACASLNERRPAQPGLTLLL